MCKKVDPSESSSSLDAVTPNFHSMLTRLLICMVCTVAERASWIARVRELAKGCADAWVASERAALETSR